MRPPIRRWHPALPSVLTLLAGFSPAADGEAIVVAGESCLLQTRTSAGRVLMEIGDRREQSLLERSAKSGSTNPDFANMSNASTMDPSRLPNATRYDNGETQSGDWMQEYGSFILFTCAVCALLRA